MPNPNFRLVNADEAQAITDDELGEADEIVRTLRLLAQQVSSPIIKVCLEDACADIEHLSGAARPAAAAREEGRSSDRMAAAA